MPILLGLDVGGSKTEAAIADQEKVLGRGTTESSKLSRVGEYCAGRALNAAIRQACMEAHVQPEDITGCVVGLAGASRQKDVDMVRALVRRLVVVPIEIVSDAVVAHRAAFDEAPGVIVIAGTGSVAYGRNQHGIVARAGGWGPVVSDQGSGEWIGRHAISAILRTIDNAQGTALMQAVLADWQLEDAEDIARLANSIPPPDFASLVPSVLHAAHEGDAVARDLLTRAGTELAGMCTTVIGRLWSSPQPVRVAIGGGVLNNAPVVRDVFKNAVTASQPQVVFSFGHVRPVDGAVTIARRKAATTAAHA
jgi:N-acetylglucosamine kinase-like BadF-type ATPase